MTSLPSRSLSYTSAFSTIEMRDDEIKLPLKPYQAVIRTNHTTLNPVEVKMRPLAFIPGKYRIGMDFSGVIEQVGSDLASEYKPGDRVCGFVRLGGFVGTRTLIDIRYGAMLHTPKELSDEEAAGFPLVLATAWAMIENAKIEPDSNIVVLGGATSVGAFLLQLLKKHFKVKHVLSVNSASSNEFVKSYGADETIDYRTQDVKTALKKYVAEHGRFNLILDAVGGYEVLSIYSQLVGPFKNGDAYISCCGDVPPGTDYTPYFWQVMVGLPWMFARIMFGKRMGINYALVGAVQEGWTTKSAEFFGPLGFKVPIDTVYPVSEFKAAQVKMEKVQARGKIVLKYE